MFVPTLVLMLCAEEVYVTAYLCAEFVRSVSTVVCQRRTCDY